MRARDLTDLFVLAALWGAAFLFMRVGVPSFGFVPVAGLRVMGACVILVALMMLRGEGAALRQHWKPALFVGVTNSAGPFLCFAYAALYLNAGLSAIFNAATPLFGAFIAWLWLRDRLTSSRVLGLVIGFAGVFGLAYTKATVKAGADDSSVALAVAACLVAAALYGFSASYTKKYLTGVPPMASAAGSQLGASLVLLIPTMLTWPAQTPGAVAWLNLLLLAVMSTGVAYVLYFRLIANVGPANAITVTFLIPAFAMGWGALFLGEALTVPMVVGCAVILIGTALATGVWQRHWSARAG